MFYKVLKMNILMDIRVRKAGSYLLVACSSDTSNMGYKRSECQISFARFVNYF
jgi:hypothetical protein